MTRNWLRSGHWVVALALAVMSLWVPSSGYTNDETQDKRFIPVEYDGLIWYTLDATTMKRYTGLSGNTLVDVWIEGHPADDAARRVIQAFFEGDIPGVDFEKLGTLSIRYLFRIGGQYLEQEAVAVIIERQYLDLNGGVMRREPFKPPGDLIEWRSLNSTEKKALQAIMEEPAFQAGPSMDPALRNSAPVKDLDEGFLDWPWGTQPNAFAGVRYIADIPQNQIVYSANLDLAPVLGNVSTYSSPRLVFEKDGGLVKAHMDFDAKEYDTVHARLTKLLGESTPIMYELRTASMDFIQRSEWLVGRNTKLVLTWKVSGATIEISKRDLIVPESTSLENTIAAAQWKQAQEYVQKNRIPEASSLYQELLNGTGSYCVFTPEAQEQLAKYSRLDEAAVYLGVHRNQTFYGLKNIFTDSVGQQWVRINLGPEAREDLQQQRPGVSELQDRLSNISAVLCRVKVIPLVGKYLVVEQVWLDDSNQIIDGRPAWTTQDSGWPAPYIKQACEDFLEAWFSVGSTAV